MVLWWLKNCPEYCEVKVESCTQIEGKFLLGLRIVGEGMVSHSESKLYRTIASESTNPG